MNVPFGLQDSRCNASPSPSVDLILLDIPFVLLHASSRGALKGRMCNKRSPAIAFLSAQFLRGLCARLGTTYIPPLARCECKVETEPDGRTGTGSIQPAALLRILAIFNYLC